MSTVYFIIPQNENDQSIRELFCFILFYSYVFYMHSFKRYNNGNIKDKKKLLIKIKHLVYVKCG